MQCPSAIAYRWSNKPNTIADGWCIVQTMVRPPCANCFNSKITCVDIELSRPLQLLWDHPSNHTINWRSLIRFTLLVHRKTLLADYQLAPKRLRDVFAALPKVDLPAYVARHTARSLLRSDESKNGIQNARNCSFYTYFKNLPCVSSLGGTNDVRFLGSLRIALPPTQ